MDDRELRRLVTQAARAAEQANRLFRSGVLDLVERHQERLQALAAWIEQNSFLVRQLPEIAARAREAARRFEQAFRKALPPNWSGLSLDEVFATIDLIDETGFSLVWAPREEIVRSLLAVPPEERDALLLSHRDEIVVDLEALAAETRHPRLRDIPTGLRAAVGAFKDRHHEAAQALATVLLTALVHGPLRIKGHTEARGNFGRAYPTDAAIEHLRLAAITLAAAKALEDFNPMTLRPRHERYNRHASAHSYLREQYHELAALSALLLAGTLARECDYWLTTYGALPDDLGA